MLLKYCPNIVFFLDSLLLDYGLKSCCLEFHINELLTVKNPSNKDLFGSLLESSSSHVFIETLAH